MYLPFGFLALSVLTGGDLIGDIIGIAAGHCYYYLKDVVPITFRKDFLVTPNFIRKYLDNIGQPEPQRTNYTQQPQSNPQPSRGSFSAFSGRGTTWS